MKTISVEVSKLVARQRKLLKQIDELRKKDLTPEQIEKLDELERKLI